MPIFYAKFSVRNLLILFIKNHDTKIYFTNKFCKSISGQNPYFISVATYRTKYPERPPPSFKGSTFFLLKLCKNKICVTYCFYIKFKGKKETSSAFLLLLD